MAKSEPQNADGEEYYTENEDSAMDGDDSEEDPTFDILEETRSSLSKLSLKKSKSSASRVKDSDRKRKIDFEEVETVELNEVDAKSFENVEKMIKAGQLEKLKIDQCKVYLRKHGLRLTGTKAVLIERIREHLGIIDGGGEQKYPAFSFILNCKGDACTGDIVMFEHNVYETYNIASRSAGGPAIGTRVVAGRIVKESYGVAKQQHTFTIEVLWSKGVKPLAPLHPLLIKGRNLYRLKTLRQKWTDEAERSKVLQEKHLRGSLARSTRETRVQDKKMRMNLKGQRVPPVKSNVHKENQEPVKSNYLQQATVQTQRPQQPIQPASLPNKVLTENDQNAYYKPQASQTEPSKQPIRVPAPVNQQTNNNLVNQIKPQVTQENNLGSNVYRSWLGSLPEVGGQAVHVQYGNLQTQTIRSSYVPPKSPVRQKLCRFYSQGRCSYGGRCKFLHENSGEQRNVPPQSPHRNPMQHQHCRSPMRPSYVPPRSPQRNGIQPPHRSPLRPFPGKVNSYHGHGHASRNLSSPPRVPLRNPTLQPHCQYFAYGTCHHGDNCRFQHVYKRPLQM